MQKLQLFSLEGEFLRGNIHGHTTMSDGALTPQKVCERYRQTGYDFLAVTDHFTSNYGFKITDTSEFQGEDFSTILGAEIHCGKTSQGEIWHILAVGLPLDFPPIKQFESASDAVSKCIASGAFVGIAHPHWYNLSVNDALSLEKAHAVEIYNHLQHVSADRGYGTTMWDAMLCADREVFGIAVDDSHWVHPDQFGGWVMVKVPHNKPHAIVKALKNGDFYSSQGPTFNSVSISREKLCASFSPCDRITIVGPGSRRLGISNSSMTQAPLPLEKFANGWIRLTITDSAGKRAWLNPHYLD